MPPFQQFAFLSLAENSPYFIGICDNEMKAWFVNAAGRRAVGIGPDEDVTKLAVMEFFFPEDRPFMETEFFDRVMRDGKAEVEVRFRHFKTGEAIWMLYNVFPVADDRGERIGFATVSRDITNEIHAREALRASEHRQSLLVRLLETLRETNDPMAMMTAASEVVGRELQANRVGFFEMADDDTMRFTASWTDGVLGPLSGRFPAAGIGTRYLAEVRKGRTIATTDMASDPLTSDSHFDEIGARSGIGAPIIRNGRWHAGMYVNHAVVREWTNDEVELVRYVADQTWDAVERAVAQQRFEQVAELAPQFLFVTRADGVLEYVNEQWTAYSGLDCAATANRENVAALTHPEDRPAVERKWQEALGSGQPLEAEFRLRGRDGSYRWFLARTAPLRDENGRVVRWFTATTDIDAQKEAAHALLEIDHRKDEFLATLSHELRTPLTAGYGWVKLLEQTNDPVLHETGLQAVEQSFKTQIRLIDDLLDVSRIIAGKMQFEMQPLDLAVAIEAAIDTVRPAAKTRNITLVADIRPGIMITGDAERVTQIVWNLLSNAIKFTPAGGTVEIRLLQTNTHAEVRVRDTGQGIDPEFLPYVFDRFRQGDSSVNRRYGGLGLGLSIVASLAEAHKGSVRAESEGPGKGATFIVTFPMLDRFDIPAPRFNERLPATDAAIAGARILVVDDDEGARTLMSTILERAGAEVRAFRSANDAMLAIADWRPDVLLSDLSMPTDDGYSLVRNLRAAGNDVPALAVTAYVRTEDAARNAGFQAHLPKPFTPESLIAKVKELTVRR